MRGQKEEMDLQLSQERKKIAENKRRNKTKSSKDRERQCDFNICWPLSHLSKKKNNGERGGEQKWEQGI